MGCGSTKIKSVIPMKQNILLKTLQQTASEKNAEITEGKYDKDIGLAYEIPLCPRGKHEKPTITHKPSQQSKKNILLLKSFTLDRNIQSINVMQARNYLKRPYMKPSNSTYSMHKAANQTFNKTSKSRITFYENLEEIEVFEDKTGNTVKRSELHDRAHKTSSLKIRTSKNSSKKDFNQIDYDIE